LKFWQIKWSFVSVLAVVKVCKLTRRKKSLFRVPVSWYLSGQHPRNSAPGLLWWEVVMPFILWDSRCSLLTANAWFKRVSDPQGEIRVRAKRDHILGNTFSVFS
jgi:hypothetical protein